MLYIGVIEWASESLLEPSVFVGDPEAILHWAARKIQDYIFDDGGEIDQHRDTYRKEMAYEELVEWHDTLWEYTTDAWVGVYELQTAEGEADCLGRDHAS